MMAWVLLLVALALFIVLKPGSMTMVHSSITGKSYSVRKAPDSQQVADRLAVLEQRLQRLRKSFLAASSIRMS